MASLYEQAMADDAGDYMTKRIAVVTHELNMWSACRFFNGLIFRGNPSQANRAKLMNSIAGHETSLARLHALTKARGSP